MSAAAQHAIADDSRALDPVAYIRAIGLRPEDSYGFLPLDLHSGSSFFFMYRDRPEYATARAALPAASPTRNLDLGAIEVDFGSSRVDTLEPRRGPAGSDAIVQAMQLQEAWSGDRMTGDPGVTMLEQLRLAKMMGLVDERQHQVMLEHLQGEAGQDMAKQAAAAQAEAMASAARVVAGPRPPVAAAPAGAPAIVADRLYPGLYKRVSTRQLNTYIAPYRDALGLCSEDVYGVFPRDTRSSSSGEGGLEWDDFWILYRDRPEYAQGREAWAEAMHPSDAKPLGGLLGGKLTRMLANQVGGWPPAQVFPGVVAAGSARCEREPVAVQKDRWPREKVVLRKKGSDLGDALREKLDAEGYQPEDSFGLCPDYDNGSIYFAWRTR